MDKEEKRQRLSEIAELLLKEESHAGLLLNACNELRSLFMEITGVGSDDLEADHDKEDIFLSSGKAISTWSAGRCITEFSRTTKYLRALHDAIMDLLKSKKERPLRVLYAGCGPYATLVHSPDGQVFTRPGAVHTA